MGIGQLNFNRLTYFQRVTYLQKIFRALRTVHSSDHTRHQVCSSCKKNKVVWSAEVVISKSTRSNLTIWWGIKSPWASDHNWNHTQSHTKAMTTAKSACCGKPLHSNEGRLFGQVTNADNGDISADCSAPQPTAEFHKNYMQPTITVIRIKYLLRDLFK